MDKVKKTTLLFQDRLQQENVEKFLTFPNEELILGARKHPIPLILQLFQIFAGTFFAAIIFSVVSFFFFQNFIFSVSVYITSFLLGMGFFIKELTNWYFHFYIITTRRIAEVEYSPLFSELSNSVLLDQLRCTEIDAELHGFISELFDLGDVTITFDRPTHQTDFVLKGVRSPRKVANYLSAHLHNNEQKLESQHVWLRPQTKSTYSSYGNAIQN